MRIVSPRVCAVLLSRFAVVKAAAFLFLTTGRGHHVYYRQEV